MSRALSVQTSSNVINTGFHHDYCGDSLQILHGHVKSVDAKACCDLWTIFVSAAVTQCQARNKSNASIEIDLVLGLRKETGKK